MLRPFVKMLLWLGAASLVGTVVIGFAHTEAGRPVLAWLMATTGCPVTLDGADPVATERYRVTQMKRHVGADMARSHPAFGFELGVTRRSDVDQSMAAHHVECESVRDQSVLRCMRVESDDARDPLPARDVHLQFDAQQRLVAVDLFRDTPSEGIALAHLDRMERALNEAVGPVTRRHGEASASYLTQLAMRRVSRGYHYRDYVATLSATWLGNHARLREQYQWLPPTPDRPQRPGGG